MYNKHHTSFGKQIARALWGILLSVGFGGFWFGLCTDSVWLSIAGGGILTMGVMVSIRAFANSNSHPKSKNNRHAYHGHSGHRGHSGHTYRPRY